jgi:hypothetical protein
LRKRFALGRDDTSWCSLQRPKPSAAFQRALRIDIGGAAQADLAISARSRLEGRRTTVPKIRK